MTTKKMRSLLTLAAMSTLVPAAAMAVTTTTTTFQVTASVTSACSMTTPATLAFGAYDPTSGTPTVSTTNFNVTCTLLTPYTLKLDAGTTSGGAINARLMTDGASHTLGYGLYTTVLYSAIWGDGTSGNSSVAGVGTGIAVPQVVYGRIPAGQNVPAGSYSDLITLSMTF